MRNAGIVLLIVLVVLIAIFFALRKHDHSRPFIDSRARQSFTGIGLMLRADKDGLEIMGVLPDTPAARAGLHRGLSIQQINGTNVVGMPLKECIDMTRGPVGSEVKLEIVDTAGHQTNVVEFTREKILLPAGRAPEAMPGEIKTP